MFHHQQSVQGLVARRRRDEPGRAAELVVRFSSIATVALASVVVAGAVMAALTVGLHRGTALLSLLILPLAMPIMILGANAVSLAAHNDVYTTGIWALGAYAIASVSLAPYATAAALRISNE